MPQWRVIEISTVHALESIAPTCNKQKQHELLEAQIEALDYHGMTYKASKLQGELSEKEKWSYHFKRSTWVPTSTS